MIIEPRTFRRPVMALRQWTLHLRSPKAEMQMKLHVLRCIIIIIISSIMFINNNPHPHPHPHHHHHHRHHRYRHHRYRHHRYRRRYHHQHHHHHHHHHHHLHHDHHQLILCYDRELKHFPVRPSANVEGFLFLTWHGSVVLSGGAPRFERPNSGQASSKET